MKTQDQISQMLGISQSAVSLIMSGKRAVTWPVAVKLAALFPGKSITEWKKAQPEDIRRAFLLL